MQAVDLLRLMLPPLHQLDSGGGSAVWRVGTSPWQGGPYADLADLGNRFRPKRLEIAPHPADLSMADTDMPALPPKRMRAAVLGAVELMALGGTASLAVGFGPRNAQGRVPVAWMSAEALARIVQALRQQGLAVSAVLPPTALLPEPPAEEDSPINAVAMRTGEWVVLRTGPHEGLLQPLPPGEFNPAQAEERLRLLLPDGGQIRWISEDELPAALGTSGPAMWTLPVGRGATPHDAARWMPATLGWCAAIAAVWAVGLHMQAARMADEGKGLRRQMAEQVKAAFPEVPVVLNPLQQARQLREAHRAGTGGISSSDAAGLLRAATTVLTQAEGQVQQLSLRDGQVQVLWREGHSLGQDEIQALQTRARERGLLIQPEARGLRLQVDPAQVVPAPAGPQVADAGAAAGGAR